MSAEAPDNKKEGDGFDVVLVRGATEDGQGAAVLRARPGRVEAGEVRPIRDGRPLAAGGQIVRLERRSDAPALFDVRVECDVPAAPVADTAQTASGPPQVATSAYRESWERTFGLVRRRRDNAVN
jgi:hypothetical protein